MLKYFFFLFLGLLIPLNFLFSATSAVLESSFVPTKHIYAGDDLIATVVGMGDSSTIHYIFSDHLSGSNVVTDNRARIEEITDYFPYGKARFDQANSFKESRKFTGHTLDQDTDLTYAKARYYDGTTGKFFSQDPAVVSIMSGKDHMQIEMLSNPQSLNSYGYALNNPLKYVDPDGKKVELVERRVPGSLIGVHTFFLMTPDHPSEVSIQGVPPGTAQFTMGGYNVGGFAGVGNTLQKDIGFRGDSTLNQDNKFLIGQKEVMSKTLISPPNGQTDTEFINSIGKSFNEMQTGQKYFMLGQLSAFNYGNSNNFIHELGERSGVGNQLSAHSITRFNWAPGFDRNLPHANSTSMIKGQIDRIQNSIQTLKWILKK